MSSLELPPLFDQLSRPLDYAEQLLVRFAALARSRDNRELQQGLAEAAGALSGSALSQLYLLDVTHTQLNLTAQWRDGRSCPRDGGTLSSDYRDQQLLQYCLTQNRPLHIDDLHGSLYQTDFLPPMLVSGAA